MNGDTPAAHTDQRALLRITDTPGQAAPARGPRARCSDPDLAALVELAGPVIAHRHHGITAGVAHYEVQAARAAAAAHRRGMSHSPSPRRWACQPPTSTTTFLNPFERGQP